MVGMASRVDTWGGIAMDKNLLDPFCFVSPLVLGKAEERSDCHSEGGRNRWMGLVLMKPRDNEHGLVQLFREHETLDSRMCCCYSGRCFILLYYSSKSLRHADHILSHCLAGGLAIYMSFLTFPSLPHQEPNFLFRFVFSKSLEEKGGP